MVKKRRSPGRKNPTGPGAPKASVGLPHTPEQLRQILDLVPHRIFVKDREGRYLLLNRAEANCYGRTVEEMLGRPHGDFHPSVEEVERFLAEDRQIMNSGEGIFLEEERVTVAEGKTLLQQTTKVPFVTTDAGETAVLGVAVDITERNQAVAQSDFLAHHDHLTGLPNRQALRDWAEEILAASDPKREQVALLLVDVDGLRDINDRLGHGGGDTLLIAVAHRIRGLLKADDIPARPGGDEFAILRRGLSKPSQARDLARTLLANLSQPFIVHGQAVNISCGVGIALYPDHGTTIETLFQHGEVALQWAKATGRNCHLLFRPEMITEARHRRHLEGELRQAIEQGTLRLHYQPQMDLHRHAITGVEALVRWPHQRQGMIPPGQFIPIAEDSGLIIPLGDWVLREACLQAHRWQQAGKPLRVAVNLSLAQLQVPGLHQRIMALLDELALEPRLLELEITESLFMDPALASMSNTLARLVDSGVGLALDDFGTGYSSLNYLKRFPVDTIKIDQSFVRNLPDDPEDRAISETILALSDRLGKWAIAEGVENDAQLAFLETRGCDGVQGYLIAKPQPAGDIDGILGAYPGQS